MVRRLLLNAATLLRIDDVALRATAATRPVHSAVLMLDVAQPASYQGANCAIQIHPMRREWEAASATWSCARDTNPTNASNDCPASDVWAPDGAPPWDVSQTLATFSPCNLPCTPMSGTRVIEIDFTDEVRRIAEGGEHLGWALTRDAVDALQAGFANPRIVVRWRSPSVPSNPPGPLPSDAPTTIVDLGRHLPGVQGFDPSRLSIVRGRVRNARGEALANVAVRVLGGEAAVPPSPVVYTRPDGIFDLPVEGGGDVTVVYADSTDPGRPTTPAPVRAHIPVQRTVDVPVRDWVWAPDVALREYDAPTPVNFGGQEGVPAARVVSGSPSSDLYNGALWTRTPRLFVSVGTTAQLASDGPNGAPLQSLALSLSEFTVDQPSVGALTGPRGQEFMPGTLPPTSAYTLALEFAAFDPNAPNGAARDVVFRQPNLNVAPVVFCIESPPGAGAFPVGSVVPVGSYDRAQGRWESEVNGRVVSVEVANNSIALDVGTTNQQQQQARLDALGITPSIAAQMRSAYAPPQGTPSRTTRLWCSPVRHFSAWDFNFPFRLPTLSTRPTLRKGTVRLQDPCRRGGSIIECDNQALGEELGLVGAPYTLHYQSDRTRARLDAYRVQLPLWPEAGVPPEVKEVSVEIQVVGRRYERVLRLAELIPANRVFTWIWDGRDGEGRVVEGAQNATIRVGYGYEGQYAATPEEQQRSFAAFEGGASTTLGVARGLLYVWETRREQLGLLSARTAGLGGWTLDVHHAYDPLASTLYLGTGHRRTAETLGRTVRTVAGGASGNTGEGSALERELLTLRAVTVRRDGVVYFSHNASSGSTVRRLVPAGPGGALVIENVLPHVAGAPAWSSFEPRGIAFGPDDTLYIAEQATARVLALPARCLATPAPGDCSDASAATYVQLPTGHAPEGLAVGPDGILYVSVPSQHVVYQVRPNGPGLDAPIAPVAVRAAGVAGEFGDRDGPVAGAMSARLRGPGELAIARDGSVLIADAGNCRVRRLDPSGRVRTVAGNGCGGTLGLDGTLATASSFRSVRGLAVDRVGGFYFGGGDNAASTRVWRVAPDGTFATVARTVSGVGAGESFGDGRLATEAAYNGIAGLALDPNGALVLLDGQNNRVRRIAPALPNVPLDAYVLPSEDGGALYRFDARGRHVETRDALTGQVLFEFGYTQGNARLLERVIDRRLDGQRTTQIVRTGVALTSIVAPSGQTTALAGLSQGDLTSVEPPHGGEAAEPWAFTYEGEQGLLASMTEPTGATHRYDYDALGRLTHDSDGAGVTQTLTRTETEAVDGLMRPVRRTAVTLSSPMGRNTIFASVQREDGLTERSSTDSAARVATSTRDDEGRTEATLADGTRIRRETAADPRLGGAVRYVSRMFVQLAGGAPENAIVSTVQRGVTYFTPGADPADPNSWATLTERVEIAGRRYETELSRTAPTDAITVVTTTPTGRQRRSVLRPNGRLIEAGSTGATPQTSPAEFTYAAETQPGTFEAAVRLREAARLASTPQESPRAQLEWYPAYGGGTSAGWLRASIDPEGYRTAFSYDPAGRPTEVTLPGNELVAQRYVFTPGGGDTRFEHVFAPPGRSVAPPGLAAYRARFDVRGLLREEVPAEVPGGGATNNPTRVEYDLDGAATRVVRPDTSAVTFAYDAPGRLQRVAVPGAAVAYEYAGPGQALSAVERTVTASPGDGSRLTMGYEFGVSTSVTWTGAGGLPGVVQGSVAQMLDPSTLRPTTVRIMSGSTSATYPLDFDSDGLLTRVDGATYEYDANVDASVSLAQDRGLLRRIRTGATGTTGVVSRWEYERTLNRLTSEETFGYQTGSPVELLHEDYARDRLGRIVRRTERVVGEGSTTTWYCYDAAGRLSAAIPGGQQPNCESLPAGLPASQRFTYGANGTPTNLEHGSATYDAQDRLTNAGNTDYAYAFNGQRATRTVRAPNGGTLVTAYVYDGFGALQRLVRPQGSVVEYVYDAAGRRVAWRLGGQVRQRLLYLDALRPAVELHATEARITRVFEYGSRRSLPDQVISPPNGARFRIISDHVGSPRLAVNVSTGEVVARWKYDAWGREMQRPTSGEWATFPFGFAGGLVERDPATGASLTGLVRFGARDYDPETRQWLERDPSGFSGGLNLYGYVAGDPVNWVDADGNHPVLVGVAVAAAWGAAEELAHQFIQGRGTLECIDADGIVRAAVISGAIELSVATVIGAVAILAIRGGSRVARPAVRDLVYRAPQPHPYVGPSNPVAARTPGQHLWGGEHLPGSPFESWTSNRAVAEEFALSRGTTVLELDLNTVRDRIAADLRTQAGRDAAAAAEEVEMYANLLRVSRADAEVILRRIP